MKIAFLLLTVLLFMSCGPVRKDYELDECFTFADCMSRSKDKAICSTLGEACRDAQKEKRVRERLKYCAEQKPSDMSENECRLFLNQR